MSFEDADGLIERARGFVINSVQEWKTSGRVKIIPAFIPWIAYLPRAEKGTRIAGSCRAFAGMHLARDSRR